MCAKPLKTVKKALTPAKPSTPGTNRIRQARNATKKRLRLSELAQNADATPMTDWTGTDADGVNGRTTDSIETLPELEAAIGIADWIDPETGEPAEGQSPPHLDPE